MWHPLLSPFYMATAILCLQRAASSRANSTGGPALALDEVQPQARSKMAASPALGHADMASLALSPQRRRAEAPPAQRGGHKSTTNTAGFGSMAAGHGGIKGEPTFIMEVNTRPRRKTCSAEQGTIGFPNKCCFWNDIVWGFTHHACRCLTHNLDLLYHGLILPVCKVTSILVTILTGIQLLARCVKSYQSQRRREKRWPESPRGMIRGAAAYPECAICLQAYEPGAALKVLSCSHVYHGRCIDLWHRAQPGSKTCPLCLRSVTAVALVPLGAPNGKQE